MSAVAVYPEKIKKLFVTDEANEAGQYTVKVYIRGKPWLVQVDDVMLFRTGAEMPEYKVKDAFDSIFGIKQEKTDEIYDYDNQKNSMRFSKIRNEHPALWV